MKIAKWLGFFFMVGAQIVVAVYMYDYFSVAKLPLMFLVLSACCSILYLLDLKSKAVRGITYSVLIFVFILSSVYFLFYRRPIGGITMVSSITVIVKLIIGGRKIPKHKFLTRFVWIVTVAVIIGLALFIILRLGVFKKLGFENGTSCLWGKSDETLFYSVSKDATTDEEIVKAAYYFTMDSLEYDYDCEPVFQYFNIRKTFDAHKGLCFDYAHIFAAFCRSRNIPCLILDGYQKINSSSLHTWNRVYFNNTWYNVDVTFDDCSKDTKYGFHKIERYDSADDNYVITNLY